MGFSRRRRRAKASQNFLDHDHKDVSTSSQFYQMPSELVEPSSLLNEPGKSQDTHGTEITPALNTANPGDRLLGSRKKNTTAYGDIEESLKHIGGNSYKGKSYIVCLYFDCDIRAISRLAMSQESASLDNPIEYNIREHVIFVSSEPRDEGSKAMGIKASTCIEFMQQRWGAQGVQLLTDVSRLCAMGVGTRLQNVLGPGHQTKLTYFLSFDKDTLKVEFVEKVLYHRLMFIVKALDWICKAIRCPPPQDSSQGLLLSTSTYNPTRATGPTRDDQIPFPRICMNFSISTEALDSVKDSCWQKLFNSAFVLVDEDSKDFEPLGKGLEMSFDLMTRLAAIEYHVEVKGGVILAGYQTVLFPTQLGSTYAQFHFEVSDNGQINPFDLKYKSRMKIKDYARIQSMRCFLGWCNLARIQLGSRRLRMSVTYSVAREKGKTLQRSGISTGFQVTSASPVQAGINGQMSYSFVSHRLRFQPSSDYIKMLHDTSKDVALIADVQARRSWLVPKLSLMLHMAHAWVAIMSPSPKDDLIPFVEPHEDGRDAVNALAGHGDIVICGQHNDSFTLRRLLMGLSLNLLASVGRKARSTKKVLYGYEFMELVSEPGRGGFMKELKINPSQRWLALANLADAVIACSKLGKAIIPAHEEHRKNRTCDIVPCGHDYLAVHLTCIGRLMDRAGVDKNTFDNLVSIPLSHNINWTVSGNPFETFNHECDGADTCWTRQTMLQSLDRDRVFRFKRSSQDQNSILRSKSRDMKGAVVFGKRRAKVDKVL